MPPMMDRIPEKPKNFKKAVKETLSYASSSMLPFIIVVYLSIGSTILMIVGPNQLGRITDEITKGLATSIDMDAVLGIAYFIGFLYILSALFSLVQGLLMAGMTQNIAKTLRSKINAKIARLPLKYFATHSYGDVLSRATNDVDLVSQSLANSLTSIISAFAQFAGCLVMMIITNWILAGVTVASTLLGLFFMIVVVKHSQRYFKMRQVSLGQLNGYIEEMYNGHDVIRISNAEQSVKERFVKLNDAVRTANFKSQFLSGLMPPVMNFVGNLGYVCVWVAGALLLYNGMISFGVITSFIIYVRLFEGPLRQISQNITNLQSAAAASERVFAFLDEEELPDESEKNNALPGVGAVEFDHVKFAYPDRPEKEVIHDFSASVKAGQKIAIVGPTGAGKTTIVNLLMRFHEVTGGQIRIDGVPITDVSREEIHRQFGMVLQDTWMFEGTVRENLVYNMEGVTDDDLVKVCKACGLYHFVETLPQKFDTVLTANSDISVGQKQLLTIARAMLQNNPMLILDEATSSIDTRTEMLVQRAMDNLMASRTSFVIAHRLSTIRNADLILVMQKGDIVEQGTHESLMELGGAYAELYNSQFETA
ncbi:MAG: ABC transporter ATP-binding protein [Lachnospiraceae bacterium]|nr:ABC transporter ATP-binding protein [Lachnospiraceae bacterium]